ncbi:MAG: 16S rRNA (guanine(527)-N(7))-methyltransferase RsmG [Eubacteriaceae bacterium]|jgi:16S rRNA (guanine527-N7)-methyltransferase|nr:16S rRNA (guanine(527)-N(7))-methyltransferase RsmG [Eubacteriaceae bacterium]
MVEYLLKELKKMQIELSYDKAQLLLRFMQLVLTENEKYNLTAIKEPKEFMIKHFIDSLSLLLFLDQKKPSKLADVGSGAGFPGIPLAVANEKNHYTLIEATKKKTDFLAMATEELVLSNVKIIQGRAEELGREEAHRESYDIVVARAVAPLPILLELCAPLLAVGGTLLAMKGNVIEEASTAMNLLGLKTEKNYAFSLPEAQGERRILVLRKERNTPSKYPRSYGQMKKNPL